MIEEELPETPGSTFDPGMAQELTPAGSEVDPGGSEIDPRTKIETIERNTGEEIDFPEDEPEPVDPSVTPDIENQFNRALSEVKFALPKINWDRFESMKLISVNGTWKVQVPRLNYGWITSRYVDGTLNRILKAMTGETVKVEFVIGGGK